MPDAIDALDFSDTFENPERYELVMQRIYEDARQDPGFARELRNYGLQEDLAQAFDEYCKTSFPDSLDALLTLLGYDKSAALCELGCGRGLLAYALDHRGYHNITAMDPNNEAFTGTKYLRAIAPQIPVINDLATWRKISARFDVIISKATIHHWQHIPMAALDARRTLKPGGLWLAFDEFFVTTPADVPLLMNGHLLSPKYRTYEWPYPATAYIDMICSVGFDLVGAANKYRRRLDLPRSRLKFWSKILFARMTGGKLPAPCAMIFRRKEL